MTAHKNQKRLIRDRMKKTGESYTTARRYILEAGDGSRTPAAALQPPSPQPLETAAAPASGPPSMLPTSTSAPALTTPEKAAASRTRRPSATPRSKFSEFDDKYTPTRDPKVRGMVRAYWGRRRRPAPVPIGVGLSYRVEPLNPQKKKHRGRTCIITELEDSFFLDRVAVKFLDERKGWAIIDSSDLVPIDWPPQE